MNTANDNVKDILDMNNYRVEKLKQTKKKSRYYLMIKNLNSLKI